jgi:ribonuclease J
MTSPVSPANPNGEALRDPPREDALRVVPLGGLGEIGMNCLALEQADGIIVVDCGITFPDEDTGVDTYHPDFSYLIERSKRVAGIFLTHGHEDHVGALPYLLGKLRVPVFGPPHALAVARHRLVDRNLDPAVFDLRTVKPRRSYRVGPFDVEPVRVTHSITDATALAIRTRAGTVLHTGDFRFDPSPPDGELTDEARLAELGADGVRLMLSDSTGVDAVSPHESEATVGRMLEKLVLAAKGRVVIGMFASNMQRLQMVGALCQRAGRKLSLFGRSIGLHAQWGHEIGRLSWPSDLVVALNDAAQIPPDRLVVLAGGTQAEPGSALMKLAAGTHPALTLTPEDTVILSSRVIPGNDRPVFAMIADFLRRHLTVHSWITDPTVHTSGHAHRHEQERMLELVRPRAFVPVHGTRHHLERHAELARARGVTDVLVLENGDVGEIGEAGLHRAGAIKAGRVATWQGMDIADSVLRERRALARSGVLSVSLVVDRSGNLAAAPLLMARGVTEGESDPAALRFVALEIARAVESTTAHDDAALAETARLAARRAVETRTGKKPICLVTVNRLDDRR